MRKTTIFLSLLAGGAAAWLVHRPAAQALEPQTVSMVQAAAPTPLVSSAMVGTERREDDLPAIASSPDGSLWAAWLSYSGGRDEIGLRQYRNGQWSNLQHVPGTSGDSWLPQAGVDTQRRVWVVWSQQLDGNWDLF